MTLTAVTCTRGERTESGAGGAIWKVERDTGDRREDMTALFVREVPRCSDSSRVTG